MTVNKSSVKHKQSAVFLSGIQFDSKSTALHMKIFLSTRQFGKELNVHQYIEIAKITVQTKDLANI